MPHDSFTEVTEQSWFSRIGSAIKGIVFGILLFLGSFPLLFWNEGRAISRTIALDEGQSMVKSVDHSQIDPYFDGRLIHVSGKVTAQGKRTDGQFNVSTPGLTLIRQVEMYQWTETSEQYTENKLGGGTETRTTYHYHTEWEDDLISSSGFKQPEGHINPTHMPYQSQTWYADNARLGAFHLSSGQVMEIGQRQILTPQAIPDDLDISFKRSGQYLYHGQPTNPQVGDLRVSFFMVPQQDASIVAKQSNNRLLSYTTSNGGSIHLIQTGIHSPDAMFIKSHNDNMHLTWFLRVLGFIIMFVGIGLVLKPLSVLADVIPLFGSLVEMGTGLIAFVVALSLSLVTIAIAWIAVRPLIGVPLLIVALMVCGGLIFKTKTIRAQAAQKTAT